MARKESTKKEEVKEKPKKKTSKIDKELYWILGVMLAVILIFLTSSALFKQSQSFEYEGLAFTKTMFGEIPMYHYYYFVSQSSTTGAVTGDPPIVNLYLRIDPRENEVPVEDEISYPREDNAVYIAIDPENIAQCEYANVALANLAAFVSGNGYVIRSAYADEEVANATGKPYVTCDTFKEGRKRMVILVGPGEETRITRDDTCHKIEIANCEILPAVEKFIIQSIIDAKARDNPETTSSSQDS